jgi:membrane protein implicated in regulation of membrane protease activity
MDALTDLHAAQPFWIWLALGVILLAIEAATSTEWLLWPAVSAGVVAVVTALGLPLGLVGEVLLFAVLTVIATLLSRRLIGQRAQVVQAFVDGRGRVFVSGSEWVAEIDGAAPLAGESVVVDAIDGSKLRVRAV